MKRVVIKWLGREFDTPVECVVDEPDDRPAPLETAPAPEPHTEPSQNR